MTSDRQRSEKSGSMGKPRVHSDGRIPSLVKEPGYISDTCEAGPFIWHDRLLLLESIRHHPSTRKRDHYLVINDVETREELARFASGYSLASIIPSATRASPRIIRDTPSQVAKPCSCASSRDSFA